MVTMDWSKIIADKINEAKSRGSKKRGWVKFTKNWLTSSINYRMELSEQAIFSKLIVMADEYGPVPGLISDNDFRAMPHEYLAHLATCSLEAFKTTLEKAITDDSIFENGHGLFLTHFDDYQFTEYDRQKQYRKGSKEPEKTTSDEEKKPFGEFKNIMLTDIEYQKLVKRYGETDATTRIENLSSAIESKGYKYKSHYATILTWERTDEKRGISRKENTGKFKHMERQ